VYSLEVIDAEIPRTEYSVEYGSNSLTYRLQESETLEWFPWKTITIEPGDYENTLLLQRLNDSLAGDIVISESSTPWRVKQKYIFSSEYKFTLDIGNSTIGSMLGFDEHNNVVPKENTYEVGPYYDNIEHIYETYDLPNTDIVHNFSSMNDFDIYYENRERIGKLLAINNAIHEGNVGLPRMHASATITNRHYDYFNSVINDDYFFNLTIPSTVSSTTILQGINVINGSAIYQQIPITEDCTLDTIKIDVLSTVIPNVYITEYEDINSSNNQLMVELINSQLVCTGDVNFAAGTTYYLQLRMPSSVSDMTILLHKISTNTDQNKLLISNGIFNGVPTSSTFASLYDAMNYNSYSSGLYSTTRVESEFLRMNYVFEGKKQNHIIVPPGIYSLSGNRYVLLRSKEIEDHIYNSLSYGNNFSYGLAKFKLRYSGFGDERFDYSSIETRTFHPIGRLNGFTLRFESSTGKLYDFKGVNHTITFAIRYYVAPSRIEIEKSKLNPSYEPNYQKWWIENQYSNKYSSEDSSDSDTD
jgi:hypothetical protein